MKFVDSVEIGLPRGEVVALFSDPELLPKWLRGVERLEPVSREYGEKGSVTRFVFRQGGNEMEELQTATVREPEDLTGIAGETDVIFEREQVAEGMRCTTRDRLIELNPRRTRWESENEYRFDDLMMRMAAPLMRSSFQKQTRVRMRDFKAFAEQGIDVRSVAD